MGGRHTEFVGFNTLDLFARQCLDDPDVNKTIDYLFVGQGTAEAQARWAHAALRCTRLCSITQELSPGYVVGRAVRVQTLSPSKLPKCMRLQKTVDTEFLL
jgi:hypothetical protein